MIFRKNNIKPVIKEVKKPVIKVKAGIAFGGGGTRGFAHIGVIRAFEECGIEFSYIAGTSAGALAGSLYACGINSYEMEELIKVLRVKDIRNSKLFFIASNSYNIERFVKYAIGDKTFEELNKPLAIIAVDLKSGDEIVLKSGSIAKAVSASCAVPGIFTPVILDNYNLVDGGVINPIPSDVLRLMGAETVISIDLNSTRGNGTDSLKMLDILYASFRIAMKSTAVKGVINSDIMINPDLSKFKASSPKGMEEMIQIGYNAAMEVMDEIKEMLKISSKPEKDKNSKNGKNIEGNENKTEEESKSVLEKKDNKLNIENEAEDKIENLKKDKNKLVMKIKPDENKETVENEENEGNGINIDKVKNKKEKNKDKFKSLEEDNLKW